MPLLNLLLLSTFGDHLAAVRWNSRWPARSARSAASRRPPKPPKRPHCHLTRFLSWLCVRCAQQPRKFVWRLRIDADIKKTYTQTKPFFEPTFRIKWSQLLHLPRMNKQKQKNASPRLGDWWNTIPKWKVRSSNPLYNHKYKLWKTVTINTCVLVLLPSQFCVQTFFKSTLDLLSQLKKNKQHEIQRNIFVFVRKRKKNPKCDFFFRMKNPLRRSWRRLKSRREE